MTVDSSSEPGSANELAALQDRHNQMKSQFRKTVSDLVRLSEANNTP